MKKSEQAEMSKLIKKSQDEGLYRIASSMNFLDRIQLLIAYRWAQAKRKIRRRV